MKLIVAVLISCVAHTAVAQELFVHRKAASSMPKRAIGVRLAGVGSDGRGDFGVRFLPEVAYGVSRNVMVHANVALSNHYSTSTELNGGSLFAQKRLFTRDDVHSHLRAAVFARASYIDSPLQSHDVDLKTDNSGVGIGATVTQLINRTAVSASVGVSKVADFRTSNKELLEGTVFDYSVSLGYLAYPSVYISYDQPNVNLYVEFLGQSHGGLGGSGDSPLLDSGAYLDVAPGIQVILNSLTRIEFSYRTELTGDFVRFSDDHFMVAIQHSIFR